MLQLQDLSSKWNQLHAAISHRLSTAMQTALLWVTAGHPSTGAGAALLLSSLLLASSALQNSNKTTPGVVPWLCQRPPACLLGGLSISPRLQEPHTELEPPRPFAARPREAKDPINTSAALAHANSAPPPTRLEKNPNYPPVTSWLAWRGAAARKPRRWAAVAAACPGSCGQRSRGAAGAGQDAGVPRLAVPQLPVLCLPEGGFQPAGKSLFSASGRCSLR